MKTVDLKTIQTCSRGKTKQSSWIQTILGKIKLKGGSKIAKIWEKQLQLQHPHNIAHGLYIAPKIIHGYVQFVFSFNIGYFKGIIYMNLARMINHNSYPVVAFTRILDGVIINFILKTNQFEIIQLETQTALQSCWCNSIMFITVQDSIHISIDMKIICSFCIKHETI